MTRLHKFSTGLIFTALLSSITLVNTVAEKPINQGVSPVETDSAYEKLSAEDQKLIDRVQRKAFDYFWDGFDPPTGLIADAVRQLTHCRTALGMPIQAGTVFNRSNRIPISGHS
jgi:hypothetical protein